VKSLALASKSNTEDDNSLARYGGMVGDDEDDKVERPAVVNDKRLLLFAKKLVKTQINTKSAHLMGKTWEGYISRTACSITVISFAMDFYTSTSEPSTINLYIYFSFPIFTNSV
jgi:hypothetical protein